MIRVALRSVAVEELARCCRGALLLLCCCSAAGSPVSNNQFLNKKKSYVFSSWIQNASVNCEKYSMCMWSVRMHESRQIYLFYCTFYSVWNRWLPLHNDRFEVNVIIIFRFSWTAPASTLSSLTWDLIPSSAHVQRFGFFQTSAPWPLLYSWPLMIFRSMWLKGNSPQCGKGTWFGIFMGIYHNPTDNV